MLPYMYQFVNIIIDMSLHWNKWDKKKYDTIRHEMKWIRVSVWNGATYSAKEVELINDH